MDCMPDAGCPGRHPAWSVRPVGDTKKKVLITWQKVTRKVSLEEGGV
jgi:hypothetical protein